MGCSSELMHQHKYHADALKPDFCSMLGVGRKRAPFGLETCPRNDIACQLALEVEAGPQLGIPSLLHSWAIPNLATLGSGGARRRRAGSSVKHRGAGDAKANTQTCQHSTRLKSARMRKPCKSESVAEALRKHWYYCNSNILLYRVSILRHTSSLRRRSLLRMTSAFEVQPCNLFMARNFRLRPGPVRSFLCFLFRMQRRTYRHVNGETATRHRFQQDLKEQQFSCFAQAPARWVSNMFRLCPFCGKQRGIAGASS